MDQIIQNGSAKRRRTRQPVPFQPGFLRSIKVWNFTTYSYTEFVLSPTLNMIIGPNGSGKSTLVAAICIGLAGKIDLIKRKNLKSMIKTGQERAKIEITMENFSGLPPIRIKRDFSAKESVWYLDDKKCTESAIKNLRKKFNIQLDNLCHFLPQERVAEFAGLSPEKLLLETERTLKDGHLLSLHEDLIEKDNKSQEYEIKIDQLKSRLEVLHGEREKLEEEARKLEAYDAKSREVENHRMLLPYAKWHDIKTKQADLRQRRNESKKRLTSFDKNFVPLKQNLEEIKEQMELQETKTVEHAQKLGEIKSKIDASKEEMRNAKNEITGLKLSLESYKTRTEQKRRDLELAKVELAELQGKLDNSERIDQNEITLLNAQFAERKAVLRDRQEKVEELNLQVRDLGGELSDLNMKIDRMRKKLDGSDKLELLMLASNHSYRLRDESFRAHLDLRKVAELQGKYYEAPVISCNVTDKALAPALEKIIDNNTLFAFTVTSNEGYAALTHYSQQRKSNTPLRQLTEVRIPTSELTGDKLSSLGFDGYLIDYIKGPSAVLSMLCKVSKLHMIPVTRRELSESQLKRLTDSSSNFPFKKFIVGDTLFTIIKSRYGSRQVSYSTEKILNSKYFAISGLSERDKQVINSQIEQLQLDISSKKNGYTEMKTQMQVLDSEIRDIKSQMSEIKNQLHNLQEAINSVLRLEGKVKLATEKVQRLERDANKDYTKKIRSYEQKIAIKYNQFSAITAELSKWYYKLSDLQIQDKVAKFEKLYLKNRELGAVALIKELEAIQEKLHLDYRKFKAEYEKIKESPEYKEIQAMNERTSEEVRKVIAELAEPYFENNTFTEETIRRKIEHLEDELSIMSTADRGSETLLRAKLAEIDRAEIDLPKFESDKSNLDERIKTISSSWESELDKFVYQISMAFSRRFSKVASDGRVELAKSERFKDWKLQIMVKFREESELKVLDHQSQSGGERAVSTIFFIMALQGLSDAPFRIVDEINQGMDPKNEQMAHRYLVHTACKNSKSQYFLVTPKLLTGLYYHPDMMVHCIFTGPLIEENNDNNNSEGSFMDFANNLISV